MRKITNQVVGAFVRQQPKKSGNTVSVGEALYLHGNKIAEWRGDGGRNPELWITTAGWSTATTKDRLNGIPGVSVNSKNYELYLNGQRWDGNWVRVF
jgi:hypothetical protein